LYWFHVRPSWWDPPIAWGHKFISFALYFYVLLLALPPFPITPSHELSGIQLWRGEFCKRSVLLLVWFNQMVLQEGEWWLVVSCWCVTMGLTLSLILFESTRFCFHWLLDPEWHLASPFKPSYVFKHFVQPLCLIIFSYINFELKNQILIDGVN